MGGLIGLPSIRQHSREAHRLADTARLCYNRLDRRPS